ncbi:MAG: cysteine peptidase family C39 domain-containing protein, partial [Bacilli bacterium]|nr:cysteine peptidase family C39 domain-containing protein [Bacilli bacterium]
MNSMRYFAFQGNDYDCGFASVKMLLCHAHRSARFLQLAKPPNHRDRYSYRDLLDIAQQNGVTLVAYKLIDKEEISKLRKFPILLSLKNANNSLHLVLLRKIRGQRVYYDDPRQGQSVMNYDDFINRWDGSFMQISKVVKVRNLNKE